MSARRTAGSRNSRLLALRLAELSYLVDLGFNVGAGPDPVQHRPGLVFSTLGDQPVRAFVFEEHVDEKRGGGDGRQAEHEPPVPTG